MRTITTIVIMLSFIFSLSAQDVSLSGMVKQTGSSTGLSGVKVSLVKKSTLSDTTDAEGKFTISNITSVQSIQREPSSFQFNLKGNCIIFSPFSRSIAGKMDIFSSNGKRIFSTELISSPENRHSIALPELSSGINVMRISIGGTTLTRTLINFGNELFLEHTDDNITGTITLQKQAAAAIIDTIIAEKEGFTTNNFPIDTYSNQDITIELDSGSNAGKKCNRETLDAIAETYVKALEEGDPEAMDLAADAVYLENLTTCDLDSGIWTSTLQVTHHRTFIDIDSCKIFVEVIDHKSTTPWIIGTQLTVKNGKITLVNALVSTEGDWLLNSHSDVTNAYDKSSVEKWSIIPEEDQNDRATIQAAGDAYLDAFDDSTKVTVPWGMPCARLEGGAYTGDGPTSTCNVGVPQGLPITDRLYVVDVEMGSVDIICKFGGGMPDSHLFRIENGKLRYVHTISYCETRGCPM